MCYENTGDMRQAVGQLDTDQVGGGGGAKPGDLIEDAK